MFTLVHVVLSLVGILAGLVVLFGMLGSKRQDGWTALFLATTVATSVTGFFFPRDHILPAHIVGVISLIVLAAAILARYGYRLAGSWRWIYVTSGVLALYLNGLPRRVASPEACFGRGADPPNPSRLVVAQVAVVLAFFIAGRVRRALFHPPNPSGVLSPL
jgi:hypothetical protein